MVHIKKKIKNKKITLILLQLNGAMGWAKHTLSYQELNSRLKLI